MSGPRFSTAFLNLPGSGTFTRNWTRTDIRDPLPSGRGSRVYSGACFVLKPSKGFRQARQKWVVRQSVGPNALSNTVSSLPQNGQDILLSDRDKAARGTNPAPPPGGVRPWPRSASRPAGVMRSLVHGGE